MNRQAGSGWVGEDHDRAHRQEEPMQCLYGQTDYVDQ